MLNTPFPPWPNYTKIEADAVSRVVLSNQVNYWTGQECREFEKEFAEFSQTDHAIALANGTLALDLTLKVLDLNSEDEVIVSPRSFIASASCVVTAGAIPIFADVDVESQNISAGTIEKVISPKTKAIIVVHLAGMPADMDPIMELAKKHNLKVIEDCAQAHGATYKGRSVGSIGHMGAWSFCQDKIMTTIGEGGMVTTNDKALWAKMWSYKDHGKSWESVYEKKHADGFRWLHDSFGTNWRMTEVQAVVGRIQLKAMPEWNAKRQNNAEVLWGKCETKPWLRVPKIPEYIGHGAYKAYAFIKEKNLPINWNRDRVLEILGAQNVPVFSGSCSEIYLEKAFKHSDYVPKNRLPVAKELGETSIMFLIHPTLTSDNIQSYCDALDVVDEMVQMESTNKMSLSLS